MFLTAIRPLLPVHPAMLLVLLPPMGPGIRQETPLARMVTNVMLNNLQRQLGSAIHVRKVDEGSHPAVVHAFDGRGVPPGRHCY